MKRISICAAVALASLAFLPVTSVQAAGCTTIQMGLLLYQPGSYLQNQPIRVGVDAYGYNYQAHSYNGNYFNAYANGAGFPPFDGDDIAYLAANPTAALHWAWPYRTFDVAMKWSDAWLSNKDCDGDLKLDRHFGFASYLGSGAWLTNHNSWPVTVKGKERSASEFIKIVAAPMNAVVDAPAGYFGEQTVYVDGKVMGDQLWGEFAVIQYVLNDPITGDHGLRLKSAINAGFGNWKP